MEFSTSMTWIYVAHLVSFASIIVMGLCRYFVMKPVYNWYEGFYDFEYARLSTIITLFAFLSINAGMYFTNKDLLAGGLFTAVVSLCIQGYILVKTIIDQAVPALYCYHRKILDKRG